MISNNNLHSLSIYVVVVLFHYVRRQYDYSKSYLIWNSLSHFEKGYMTCYWLDSASHFMQYRVLEVVQTTPSSAKNTLSTERTL